MVAMAAPLGWAAATGGSTALASSAAAAGTFLVSNPIGWAILGTVAVGAVAYGGYKLYQNAQQKAEERFKAKTIADACSTCQNCNDLQNEIEKTRNELKQRHSEMRADANGLYAARPGPIPGKEYLGTWPGHQQQFQNKQARLRKLLNAARTAGCPIPNGDFSKWADEGTPSQPAP